MKTYERINDIKAQLDLKQNIYLSADTFDALIKDMRDFEVFDNKGEINRNDFINRLIYNYSDEYITKITDLAATTRLELEKVITDSSIDFDEIATKTVMSVLSKDSDKTVRHNKIFSFRVKKKYLTVVAEMICMIPYEMDLSSFLRNMILTYLSLPIYKREQIIYKEEMNKLQLAIDKGIEVSFDYNRHTKLKNHVVSPYSLERSQNEMRNYLVVQSHTKDKPFIMSLKLSKISNIIFLNKQKAHFSDKFNKCFEAMKRNGIAYHINEVTIKEVEMNEAAYNTFKAKYLERPALIKYEDGIGYFDCSESQLNFYFNPFGDNIRIINKK